MKTKFKKISKLKKMTSYRTILLSKGLDLHMIGEPFINDFGETIAVQCGCKEDNFHPVMNGNKICCDVDLSSKVMSDPYMSGLRPGNMTAFIDE